MESKILVVNVIWWVTKLNLKKNIFYDLIIIDD